MKLYYFRILSLVFCLFFLQNGFCQEPKKTEADSTKTTPSNWKFGCGFGLNFVGGTSISLSPNLTYKISDKVSFGGGLQGSYNAIKNLQNTTTFGANVLGFYNPIKSIQTTLEFAQLRVKTTTEANLVKTSNSYWDSALFVGAGYNVTKKIAIGAKYNFLYKPDKSVYSSAVIPYVNISF